MTAAMMPNWRSAERPALSMMGTSSFKAVSRTEARSPTGAISAGVLVARSRSDIFGSGGLTAAPPIGGIPKSLVGGTDRKSVV